MKILAIQNCEIEGFGLYEQYLLAQEVEHKVVHAYRERALPPVEGFDAILIGGTPISAYAVSEHFFLQREYGYLRHALAAGVPCFGICCGAQILAQLLGAQVQKCWQREIGGYEVRLTSAGQKDPLLDGFPRSFPVFHWHGDTFEIPVGAQLLVEGDDCRNQLFRCGNVVGVQFHLEVTSKDASVWVEEYAAELAEFGKSKAQVVKECLEREREMRPLAYQLLHNFFEVAAGGFRNV
jgi:GMP synthase-like glutamine amidotransferase